VFAGRHSGKRERAHHALIYGWWLTTLMRQFPRGTERWSQTNIHIRSKRARAGYIRDLQSLRTDVSHTR
jgi:hypothetical protein